jgi:FKBP-type peptidyl-prolyl cis-trans isomerase
MMKRQLTWFIFATCFLLGIVSCSKDKEAEDPRLVNKANKEAGELFLKDNAERSEVIEPVKGGVQYEIIVQGDGIRPHPEDSVNVTYTGKLIDGIVFSSSEEDNLLLIRLIEGFQRGLQAMPEGSTYILYIPHHLAYGASSRTVSYDGKPVTILPFSVLIYEVTLHRVKRRIDF